MLDLSRFVDWIKLSTTHIVALLVASAVLLFAPDSVLTRLGIALYEEEISLVAGIVIVLSGSIVLTRVGVGSWSWLSTRVSSKRLANSKKQRLHKLSVSEREIFSRYISEDTRTLDFSLSDGIAQGLFREGFLWKPSNVSKHHFTWAYNIQPWVWDYLQDHPEILIAEAERG